jgi:fatty acid desaturase
MLATISNALAFGVSILWQYFWLAAVILGITVTSLVFWYYSIRHRKRRVQYPLVPPEGKADVYFPSSRIPRPIHEDFRKMEERKRKLKKLRKMTRKRD